MKKLIGSYLFLLLMLCFCSATVYAKAIKTIHFATEATYPPYEYIDASDQIKGFDIDIAKALCHEIKVTCTFTNEAWDKLIPSLKQGKVDALIGAIDITKERKAQVDFTHPYFNSTVSIVASKKDSISVTKEGMNGKIIGVQGGTVFAKYLRAIYGKSIKIKYYDTGEAAFLDLAAGRIDAVMGDTPLIEFWIKKYGDGQYQVIGKPISSKEYFGTGDGIAVRKGNSQLLKALNAALAKIKADGTYAKIKQKYFGE